MICDESVLRGKHFPRRLADKVVIYGRACSSFKPKQDNLTVAVQSQHLTQTSTSAALQRHTHASR